MVTPNGGKRKLVASTAPVSFFLPAHGALLATSAALILVAELDRRRSR
jgi:hypothetical protein